MRKYTLASKKAFGIRVVGLVVLYFLSYKSYSQTDSLLNKKRLNKVKIAYGTSYLISGYGLYQLWYADYQQTSFHLFDDNAQWQLMDKYGHSYSAYVLSRFSASNFRWTGIAEGKSNFYGALSSFTFLTTIEVLDGFSSNWGFSWGDMIANTSGIALFWGQEEVWGEQVVKLKYSYSPTKWREVRPTILGETEAQAAFKDYNGQTYWASINLNAITETVKPQFLNLAVGIGGNNMVVANGNYFLENGRKVEPYQQYFVSLDLDLEKINTKKKWLRSTLKLLNIIKFPFPTLEISPVKSPNFHWLYF